MRTCKLCDYVVYARVCVWGGTGCGSQMNAERGADRGLPGGPCQTGLQESEACVFVYVVRLHTSLRLTCPAQNKFASQHSQYLTVSFSTQPVSYSQLLNTASLLQSALTHHNSAPSTGLTSKAPQTARCGWCST